MSTSTMLENLRKRKRSSASNPPLSNKLRQATDESVSDSEAGENESVSSEDEVDPEDIQWDSDDLDELEDDEEPQAENETEPQQNESIASSTVPKKNLKPISKHKVDQSREAISKTGVIYLSRIPPGLNPTKIRQLLSIFSSPVLRIFLAPESQAVYLRRTKSGDSKKKQFTEGWVEFADKKVAKKVVQMLNAGRVGQRKGDKWFDDLWCMKYLPKFKWHHLTEQIAYQNASRQEKLRNEIAQEKRENAAFVQNAERSKMVRNIERKKKEREGERTGAEMQIRRQFVQKPVVSKGGPEKTKLNSVLSNVFE